jgi:hypothetical protein
VEVRLLRKKRAKPTCPNIESNADTIQMSFTSVIQTRTPQTLLPPHHLSRREFSSVRSRPMRRFSTLSIPISTRMTLTRAYFTSFRVMLTMYLHSDSPVNMELVPRGSSRSRMPTSSTTPSTPKSPRKPKRIPEEQLKLQAYAQTFFDELNTSVFRGKLSGTKLVWNVRLLITAGRASWSRLPP